MYQRIRRGLEVGSGSMVMALTLFLGLIGFNPRLAWGDMAALEVPPLLSPGSWSGTLAERFQALGYEVASIDLQAGTATVTFDDGGVLTVDCTTGAFALADARGQEELTGSVFARFLVNNDDTAEVNATFALADAPGETHALSGFLSSDLNSNGVVAVQGLLDAETVEQGVDLRDLSYRPDGSTPAPERALDEPPGVVRAEVISDIESRLLIGIIILVTVVVVVLKITIDLWAKLKYNNGMKRLNAQFTQGTIENITTEAMGQDR